MPWSLLADVPLPLLITGVAGVAGYNAMHYFAARYPGQVIGIRQADNYRLAGPGIVPCDAEDPTTLKKLFEEHQFRSVLNCAGNCALRACQLDTRLAWRTNVEGLINLASQVVEYEARLLHMSIDLVYGGRPGGRYQESEPPTPATVYGKTMASAEQIVADWLPDACVVRISLPMGISFNGHAGAIDWIQSRFAKGRPATLYFDEVRTPAYTDCLCRLFEQLLASDLHGILHAGGPRAMSLYEIAQVVNRVGGYDPKLLIGCPRFEGGPVPPRAGNVTLNSTRLRRALGRCLDPWPILPEWRPTDPEWHYRRAGEPGSPELIAEVLYRNPRKPCRR